MGGLSKQQFHHLSPIGASWIKHTTLQDLQIAFKKDGLPLNIPTNDLRKTKGLFIQHVLAKMEDSPNESDQLLTKKEKYLKGVSMWMESHLRAALTMSKQPGFGLVTAGDGDA